MMTSHALCHMMAIQRKSIRRSLSLVPFFSRKYIFYSNEQRRKFSVCSQNISSRKVLSSSLLNLDIFGKNLGNLKCMRKCSLENKEMTVKLQSIKACNYSTLVQRQLSLSNARVEKYLAHLKNNYLRALEHADSGNMKIVRNMKPLMELIHEMESLTSEIEDLKELAKDSSSGEEMQQLANSDLLEANERLQSLEEDILDTMVPTEPLDNTDVSVEVSAGVGGQEAMLFCQEIFEMYRAYADFMGWESEVTNSEETDIGGLRHGSADISGEGVYKFLKYEGGIHRVQRIPKTEKSGRIHTSTISVAVMPQPSEIDIQIASKDLKIETKRASGAGGQHVNTTDSAVRISHIPSGIVVDSQRQRSQHKNKANCMQKLRAQLYQKQLDESISKYSSSRKLQVGTKSRSEKIRTYNYPQDRITDHRIGVSLHNLPSLLQGADDLHSLICEVIKEAEKETLIEVINNFCDSQNTEE